MEEKPQIPIRGGGDPLAAMYFIAAVLMGIGALAVVIILFMPRDFFTRGSEDEWVPGSGEVYTAPGDNPVPVITPAEAERREEMHDH
jgi:hypothetical protein